MKTTLTTGGLLLPLLLSPAAALADAYTDGLRVLTHNVYMLSTNLYPNWGHPLAVPRQVSKPLPWRLFSHHSVTSTRSQPPTAPVSSIFGCDESHQTPIRIKQKAF